MDTTRTCSVCKETKKIEDFNKDKTGKGGYACCCRVCNSERGRLWRQTNGDRHRAKSAEWSRANKDRRKVISKKYREANKERVKALCWKHKIAKLYNLTPEQLAAMIATQDNRCAICGLPPKEGKVLHIDHDHATGRVRALLCSNCNVGLGSFQDDSALLAKAITYLTLHASPDAPCPNKGELPISFRPYTRHSIDEPLPPIHPSPQPAAS